MHWSRILGIALIIIGAGLLYFGLTATESLSETVQQELTGRYSDQTTWYLIGGGALALVGTILAIVGLKR
ncbi:MAG: DUF3185 family protein [Thioalkalivibrionaceae bacterium]